MKPESGNADPTTSLMGMDIDEPEEDIKIDQKLIDDVYDVNAVKPNYELRCLRKKGVLNYYNLINM